MAFLKAVHLNQFNHGPAQMLMHTGSPRSGRPSMGSWVTYGLGSENNNLPGFVVLTSGGTPDAGKVFGAAVFCPLYIKGYNVVPKVIQCFILKTQRGIQKFERKILESINEINLKEHKKFGDLRFDSD